MTGPWTRQQTALIALGAIVLGAIIVIIFVLVLGLGPFGPAATPTAPPTPAGSRLPTPAISPTGPTPTGTAIPTGSLQASTPQAPPTLGSATDVVLSHVPEALRSSCAPQSFEQPALALVSCAADGGAITVTYTLYPDQLSMGAVYEAAVIGAGIEDNSGRCYNRNDAGELEATTSRWPSENGYTVNDESLGRYLCTDNAGVATLTWTDDRLYILGVTTTSTDNVDRLLAFWIEEAGPLP